MYYVNQRNYPHICYPTMTGVPGRKRMDTTISSSGCGVCSASMIVQNLTGEEFSLADAMELSIAVGANHSPGTDMGVLAPYVAERFELDLVETTDPSKIRELLGQGYMAIANISGDRPEDEHIGLFSHGGHYVVVVDYDATTDMVTILDPSQVPGKFLEQGREGKVIENGYILHTQFTTLAEDCLPRSTEYYPEGSDFRVWLDYTHKTNSENAFFLFGFGCCCD
ncbi:MAG: C39 family peptidase [Coriobacteriales bacterium]|nr:C39 family peptidase [Coriobacteriales bacterium]